MPNDPLVGSTILRRPAIQSPNFVSGVSGWTINSDGTAQFNQLTLIVQATAAAVLIYSGTAGLGTLIGSWAGAAGTDQYGNAYPAGINVNQGVLSGVLLNAPTIAAGIITNAVINGPQISAATISQGTMTETVITLDQGGGALLGYTSTTTVVNQTVAGDYTITPPTGVTSFKVETWGADAGGGGGSSARGGEGGGAGEYACEPAYAVTNRTYNYTVGAAGQGGATGFAGTSGGDSFFDGSGVQAQGGQAGSGFVGGQGGGYGLATINFPGGNGGGDGTQSTGGCGAGGRAGSTGAGGNGAKSTSSTGAAGGTAGSGTGGHAGGSGGNAGANGNAVGGGAGTGSSTNSFTKQYRLTASATYYGSDANSGAPPNGQRGTGTMYQGGETAGGGSFNGVMKSMGIWPSSIPSDLSGASISSVTLRLENLHSWYNSGCSVALGYTNNSSLPSSYNGSSTSLGTFSIGEGATKTFSLPTSYGTSLVSGAAKTIVIGPGSGSFNLNYYGYFYGAGGDNNQNPMLTIQGTTGAGSQTAGQGSDGQVKITYTSGQALVLSASPVSGTDQFSNAFPAGLMAQALTLLSTVSAPSTPSSAAVLWADSNGNIERLMPSGRTAPLADGSGNAGTNTVTGTTFANVTASWGIPANDAKATTVYQVEAWGNGTQGSTQQALTLQGIIGSSTTSFATATTFAPANGSFSWWMRATAIISTTGSGGTVQIGIEGIIQSNSGVVTTFQRFNIPAALNTTVSNNMSIQAKWGSTTGSPTISGLASTFGRKGA